MLFIVTFLLLQSQFSEHIPLVVIWIYDLCKQWSNFRCLTYTISYKSQLLLTSSYLVTDWLFKTRLVLISCPITLRSIYKIAVVGCLMFVVFPSRDFVRIYLFTSMYRMMCVFRCCLFILLIYFYLPMENFTTLHIFLYKI